MNFLGCLLVFIFGGIFLFLAFARYLFTLLFGNGKTSFRPTGSTQSRNGTPHGGAYGPGRTTAGDARHEQSGHPNSRQRRSGKIFEKSEGEYVDFEEVK